MYSNIMPVNFWFHVMIEGVYINDLLAGILSFDIC